MLERVWREGNLPATVWESGSQLQVGLCGSAPVGRMPLVVKARSSGLEDQEVLSVKGTGNASQQVAQGHRERAESSRGKVAGHHQSP